MSENKKNIPKPPTPEISVRTMKPKEREAFWKKKTKDNLNKENLSRGTIGFISNPQKAKVTEGTLHDIVLPPSKSITDKSTNAATGKEISQEDLKKRIEHERKVGLQKKRISEETAKKLRMNMQGFKYEAPEDLKDIPFLQENEEAKQEDVSEQQTNEKQGEQILKSSDEALEEMSGSEEEEEESNEEQTEGEMLLEEEKEEQQE